tara:strand:+ start:759 stop:1478 length:720 start_codon:yes stop_codon:yes gene_type:complete
MSRFQKISLVLGIILLLQSPSIHAVQLKSNRALIPAGEFIMGTDEGTEIERPVHKVFLKEYEISRFEVTNLEFEKFQPHHIRSASSACDQCPVTMITWLEASSYCNFQRGRLPTEAEWERAGRGPEGAPYSFGFYPDRTKGNFGNEFQAGVKAVDSFSPNGFGLYNMSGNVWEWVDDWFAFYNKAVAENKNRRGNSNEKLLRGGSWYNSAYYVNVGMRFKLRPDVKLNSIGFRCAWNVP